MKAAVMRGIGNINVEDVPEPEAGPNQVKVKVAYCGICGTDPENLAGRFGLVPPEAYKQPRILGHETSGTIAAVGKNIKNYKVGQRVACDFRGHCGACYYCRNKMEHFCRSGTHASGGFAEYAVYPKDDEIGVRPFYMYSKELTIRAIFTSLYSFPRALNLLPKLELQPLITHIIPLDDIGGAFDLYKEGKSIKILIKP